MGLITLTTDFGSRDWFVGTLKGVIYKLAPRTTVVDITHEINPGDIRSAAFAVAAAFRYFPSGTVHLVVVDPGVGSKRATLAVQTEHEYFVGPDNGVLSLALSQASMRAAHRLENKRLFLPEMSRTFHGRDVFAPAAAHLSRGKPLAQLGPATRAIKKLRWPQPKLSAPITGEVVYIDRFGNAITNLPNSIASKVVGLRAGSSRLIAIGSHYQQVKVGKPIVVPGSVGYLEIAINGGDAAKKLRLRVGLKISAFLCPRAAPASQERKSGLRPGVCLAGSLKG
jgi:S-adenosylmethionine hydrolase